MNKTIVMIHGMWGGDWYWNNFKHYFKEKGYDCHTPNLRYHGIDPQKEPDPALGSTSLLEYVHDLEKYICALDEKPLLMGHSMGGLLSQILSARGLASGVVLLTPASPSGINALKLSVIKTFWSILTTWGFWRKPHRLPLDAAAYGILNLLPEADQNTVYEKFVYESGRAAAEIGFWYLDFHGASRIDESKVTCPVLVLCGSDDRITPASVAQKVAKKYKTVSTYIKIENHAHWLTNEPGWENVAGIISDWINKLPDE